MNFVGVLFMLLEHGNERDEEDKGKMVHVWNKYLISVLLKLKTHGPKTVMESWNEYQNLKKYSFLERLFRDY